MKPNMKVERINLILARIHRKMENYFCISAEIWLLPDDLRHLSINSPNHQNKPETRLSSCFNQLLRVDDKGLAVISNSVKKQCFRGRF